ncbi:MAG: aspartate 1-decarboxylase [Candidatus Omnitrophica bacterium]|nr:aspartate 1-decarboxylase [Candidatus Omnitrophota bacterium]
MLRIMCKSKIHRARITKVDLHYEGSIGIDKKLLKASDILPNEIVQVVNINSGTRFETYVIEEPAGSGAVALYGAAAHLGKIGDLVIIFSYGMMDDKRSKAIKLKVLRVDSMNRILK